MMRARSILTALAFSLAGSACSQTPVVVPLRSMERPRDVDFICLEDTGRGAWRGTSLENCAANFDRTAKVNGPFRLHAVVTQTSRGEVAVVDLGRTPGEQDKAALLKADPRIPGYSFIPVGAAPTDVVADPNGGAVYISSGRDPRIDILPASLLRGPVDTAAASADPPPWPHLEFDRETEGIPSAMAVVKRGTNNRLYVTLPDATPSAKIAVFDLTSSAIVPARIGDIALGAPAAQPLPVRTSLCGPKGTGAPWWNVYDKCAAEPTKLPGGVVTADPAATKFRPAGVAVAGGKMFVADDNAPVIHVFDIEGGAGLEIRRIAVGSSTSRLAVSPVVPDEVTLENSAAIETCAARGWLGDGLDHSADSIEVRERLGGRCRAHRYIYAIDLRNEEAGNGSIAVIDLPVTYALDAGGLIKLKDGVPETERIDFDGAELVQPMACDAPSFPARRLPLGPFGVSVGNTVPARSVAFVEVDYPSRVAGVSGKAVRCRPFATNPVAKAEYEGVPEADAAARKAIGSDWANGVSPRRLRGVFAWVALSNGALVVVDVDDYDSVCRGPKSSASRGNLLLHPDDDPANPRKEYGESRTDEYLPNPVRRHHARSLRLFDANLKPTVGSVVFSRFDAVISNDPTNENGRTYPHFAALAAKPADATRAPVVLPAPDNPFALTTETWSVTYEGMLPGFTGAFGALNDEGGKPVLRDPNRSLCDNGVESDGAIEAHDVVQLLDEPCEFGTCANPTECTQWFGATTDTPLKSARSLFIEKAHDNHLVIGNKHWELSVDPNNGVESFVLADGPPDLARIKRCFGDGLLRYTVRSRGSWVVIGSASGYLHRRIVDPASTDKACITDASQPRILTGRATELAPLTDFSKLTVLEDNIVPAPNPKDAAPTCLRFANPVWTFAIRRGTSPSSQDMRFTFGGRFNWQPLSIGAGSLIGSMKPLSVQWDGVERLNWNMIAAVDAIDRGLVVFPALEPFAYQKGAN